MAGGVRAAPAGLVQPVAWAGKLLGIEAFSRLYGLCASNYGSRRCSVSG